MKKHSKRFIAMLIVSVLVCVGSFGVVAAKYKSKLVSDDFSNASNSKFHCAGDLNDDGTIDENDSVDLAKIILETKASTAFADVNGDESIDIVDLVRLENNKVDNYFLTGGTLGVNGKCVYKTSLVPIMNTGAKYRITYKYKSTSQITVKFNCAGDMKTYIHASTDNAWVTASYDVTTALTKGEALDYDLTIDGKGLIDDFNITRVDMDNVTSAP